MILDVHTHHEPPRADALNSRQAGSFAPEPGMLYSVGVHPWTPLAEVDAAMDALLLTAPEPYVAAIGEAGIDIAHKEMPLYRQQLVFRRQVEVAEQARKPMVVHSAKAHEIVTGIYKELKPRQLWAIHGFRWKPELAQMYLRMGIMLSFGEHFNPETVARMPEEMMLAETDESQLPIGEIIARISEVRGKDMAPVIAANTKRFLSPL